MVAHRTVVTGANSGIGRATALHLAEHGHHVVGTVRSIDRADVLLAAAADRGVTIDLVELDIGDDASVEAGFERIAADHGPVDHLVNNAGIGGNGVVEESSPARLLEVMNVDLCGAVRCIRAVLPQMRERRAGTIVNITSVAGRFAAVGQAPYVAAKWALEGLSEELAHEVAPFGIRVVIVEPGVTKSSMFGKNTDMPDSSGAYAEHYARMFQMYAAGRVHATDADVVGDVIRTAIHTDEPRLRWPVSWAGVELTEGRRRITDEQWVGLGAIADRDEYVAEFERLLGLDIAT